MVYGVHSSLSSYLKLAIVAVLAATPSLAFSKPGSMAVLAGHVKLSLANDKLLCSEKRPGHEFREFTLFGLKI